MNSQVKRKLAQYDQVEPNLITLECMICFIQLNDSDHKPILICTNQHNMCKTCVDKNLFKIQKKVNLDIFLCPLCNQEVNQKNLRQNNLLLEVYKWISQISSRQKQRISLIKDDMEDLKIQTLETKKVLQKVYQENIHLHQILETLNQQKSLDIQMKKIENINELKDQKNSSNLVTMKKKLILKYQNIIQKLKYEDNQKDPNNLMKKQKQQFSERKMIFLIDKTHDHFSKFKIDKHGVIIMQGPFYRSFFQDFNYFYNLVSKNSINSQIKNLKIYLQLQIISTKKGKIFFGFGNQKVINEVNSYLKKQYFGFNIQTGDFQIYGQTIKSKLHNYKAEAASIYEFQLQYIESQQNSKIFFTVSQKDENNNKKSQTVIIQPKNRQQLLFPIVSLQIVGDSIKIRSL